MTHFGARPIRYRTYPAWIAQIRYGPKTVGSVVTYETVLDVNNLDSSRRRDLMGLLTAFKEGRRITIVMVTHDPGMAACTNRTVNFLDGQIETDHESGRAT